MINTPNYEYYKKIADFIYSKINFVPDVGIILGTGCSRFAERIEKAVIISFAEIPNFLLATNSSHPGKLIAGEVNGKKVICLNGRFHYYEGYSFEELSMPVRVLKILGITKLIITNASGAVNTGYKPGDLMIIKDHIKLYGGSPVRGQNIDEFGPRFFGVSDMYTREMRKIAMACAKTCKLRVHEGVYMYTPGPQFETPAEIKAMRLLGVDAVGMSTVTEALTAAHCKLNLLGIALITNMASGVIEFVDEDGSKISDVVADVSDDFCNYLEMIIKAI